MYVNITSSRRSYGSQGLVLPFRWAVYGMHTFGIEHNAWWWLLRPAVGMGDGEISLGYDGWGFPSQKTPMANCPQKVGF